MPPIWLIWMVLFAFAFVMILVPTIRATVFNRVKTAGNYSVPTLENIWEAIRTIAIWILILLVIGIILVVVLNIAFSIGVIILGFYANAPIRGIIIGLLFPIWCLLYLIRPGKEIITGDTSFIRRISRSMRRPFQIPYLITSLILIVTLPGFFLGVWSPRVKQSADRRMESGKGWLANSLDKGSVQSEEEAGIFARVTEETTVYNDSLQPTHRVLETNTMIRILSLEGQRVTPNREGLVHIMLANRQGDYINGDEGWIPARKLDWEGKEEEKKNPPPAASGEPETSSWKICIGGDCKNATVEFFNERTTVVIMAVDVAFTGVPKERAADGEYMGAWTMLPDVYRQPFGITFDPEFKKVNGWGMNNNKNQITITGPRQ